MIQFTDLEDYLSLILVCAIAFIPLGALMARFRESVRREMRWLFIGCRRIRRARSIEALLFWEESRK